MPGATLPTLPLPMCGLPSSTPAHWQAFTKCMLDAADAEQAAAKAAAALKLS